MNAQKQQLLITEDKFIPPLIKILDGVTQAPTHKSTLPQVPSIKESLDDLFPEQKYEEKSIQKAKEILGKTAGQFTSEQLKDIVTEIQFLADNWLDDFEREIFKGKTLKELLHEKGSL